MARTSLAQRLRSARPILIDGSMGTELARRGAVIDGHDWSAAAIRKSPKMIGAIHRDYLRVGAEIITANTFRTHERNLVRAGVYGSSARLTRLAVEIARLEAGENAWVAGSQAPLEDCYRPELTPSRSELEREHQLMAEILASAEVDVILAETHPTIREAETVVRSAHGVGRPVMVSFVCGRDGRLLSGESLKEAAHAVLAHDPLAILVNCLPADTALDAVSELVRIAGDTPVGVYANVGFEDDAGDWTNTGSEIPAVYAGHAANWLSTGAKLIGGCCGTKPSHIALLRQLIDARLESSVPSDG